MAQDPALQGQNETEWYADDMDMDPVMADEDFDFDDDPELDDEPDTTSRSVSGNNVPVWRLIEMSREDRYLARELADFEDYDDFDTHIDDCAGSYPH